MGVERVVTEYVITFKEHTGIEDYISDNKEEADEEFEGTDKDLIKQYFRKDWTVYEDGSVEEDFVEVYYG